MVPHIPYFNRIGQFICRAAPLEEEADGLGIAENLGNLQKLGERCQGARGHDIGNEGLDAVDSRRVDGRGSTGNADRFAQKDRFPHISLDEMNLGHAEDRQDQPRQPGTAAEVDQGPGGDGDVALHLRGIEDVPPPDIAHGVAAHEVDAPIPRREQIDIEIEAIERFT